MSKTSRKMISNMYETDILDLDTIDELENVIPLKTNKAIRTAAKKTESVINTIKGSKPAIITKPVDATCNKCDNKVVGELVADIYIPHIDKMMPLISYSCTHCGHVGRRSVYAQALPLEQYERKFFN